MDSFGYIGAEGVVTHFHTTAPTYSRSSSGSWRLHPARWTTGARDGSLGLCGAQHSSARRLHGASLCHFDFHTGNVLATRRIAPLTGIIDLENAIAGDPLIDLAKTLAY